MSCPLAVLSRSLLVPLAALLGLAAPTSAQSQSPPHGMTAGNFTGFGYPDLAYLRGSHVVLSTAPCVFRTSSHVLDSVAVRDVACLERAAGSRDGLLLATAGGLLQWRSWPSVAVSTLDTRSWQSVTVGHFAPSGPAVVGIADALDEVLVFDPVAGHASIPFQGQTVLALAAIDWNGDGCDELAVVTGTGLWIGKLTGQTVDFVAHTAVGGVFLARLREPGLMRLAMVSRDAAGARWLEVFAPNYHQTLLFNRLPVVGLTSGDLDADGRDDLIATTSDNANPMLLYRQPAGAPFALTQAATLRLGFAGTLPNGVAGTAAPYVGDLDADGTVDLAVPSHASETVFVQAANSDRSAALSAWSYSETGPQPQLSFTLGPSMLHPGATHVEVICYWTSQISELGVATAPADAFVLGADSIAFATAAIGSNTNSLSFALTLPQQPVSEQLPRVVAAAAVVRCVTRVGGVDSQVFPPSIELFADGSADVAAIAHLGTLHTGPATPGIDPTDGYVDPPELPPMPIDYEAIVFDFLP